MTKIVKTISLLNAATALTNSQSYLINAGATQFKWVAANYGGTVEVYFEACIKSGHASYVGYAQLCKADGTAVTGSEVSRQSTTAARVRSGNIAANMTDNTVYTFSIKSNTGSYSMTAYQARLIIIQSGTITATETQINLAGTANAINNPGSYVVCEGSRVFYWDSSKYDGTVAVYLESFISSSSGTSKMALYTAGGATKIAASELSPTSSTKTLMRSGDISGSLVNGTSYQPYVDKYSSWQGIRLVIQQTGTPTKTETYYEINTSATTSNAVAGANAFKPVSWANAEWDVISKEVFFEGHLGISNAAKVAYADLNDGTTDDVTLSTQVVTAEPNERIRSAAFTPGNGDEYDLQVRINATTAVVNCKASFILVQAVIQAAASTGYTTQLIMC